DLIALAFNKTREVRHVQRECGPKADHARERRDKDGPKLAERVKLTLLVEQVAETVCFPDGPTEQQRRHDQDKRRGPVLDFPQKVHATVNDVDVQAPEE